jgi:AcrR family transcriptional regulator
MPADSRKATQRDRLLAGMVSAANRDSYAGANVSQVIAYAGVSRPTFYDYFTDKDDCFLQANRDIAGGLLEQVRHAVAHADPGHAPQAAVRRILERAEAEPEQAYFLANATMAGGPHALDERDRAVQEIQRIVEQARARTPPEALSPDLPVRAMLGAVHWLLSPRLRRRESDLTQLADELDAWIENYNQPYREHRWHTLAPIRRPPVSPHVSGLALHAPAPPTPGKPRLSKAEMAHNQRERIMYATAEVATRKGYTASTVADITAAAHVDRGVFYAHFRDKQHAFLAVHELAIHQVLAVGARAYFSATGWPERIWQGILAASQFQAAHPTISHVGYIESHAVGEPAIQRIEDGHKAFAIFLQEGTQHTPTPPTGTATQAITAAIYETGYHLTRQGRGNQLPRYTHHAAYIALAPYLGPTVANTFIDGK